MRVYCVGGAVRDSLLGLKVQDRDYVVVGATPDEMVALGFRPVGKDFPVFLHPVTHEEYALARTERKTAKGYKGFQVYAAPEVTLEEDLARRDLTINAIAQDEQGQLVDPYGGARDLEAGILRHVSAAFVEDPLRILRIARFAARYPHFTVAPETEALLRAMVGSGEVDALVPERVWQEISRGLMEVRPSRMFAVLRDCGALGRILPEVERLFGTPQSPQHHPEIDTGIHVMLVVDCAASRNYALPIRFAALTHDLGKGTTPKELLPHHPGHEQRSVELVAALCHRLRVPNDCRDLALMAAALHGQAYRALEMQPASVLQLLYEADALRRPQRFEDFLRTCESDLRGRPGFEDATFPQLDYLRAALAAVLTVDAGVIARQCEGAKEIRAAVFAARTAAIASLLR